MIGSLVKDANGHIVSVIDLTNIASQSDENKGIALAYRINSTRLFKIIEMLSSSCFGNKMADFIKNTLDVKSDSTCGGGSDINILEDIDMVFWPNGSINLLAS
jgi:hypothetical protein